MKKKEYYTVANNGKREYENYKVEKKTLKLKLVSVIVLFILFIIAIFVAISSLPLNYDDSEVDIDADDIDKVVYDYDKSMLIDVWKDGDHAVYSTFIVLTNTTNDDLYGYLIADVREDKRIGVITEKYVYAYEESSYNKELIFIEANSTFQYTAYFKPLRDTSQVSIKKDREPVHNIFFEIVDTN